MKAAELVLALQSRLEGVGIFESDFKVKNSFGNHFYKIITGLEERFLDRVVEVVYRNLSMSPSDESILKLKDTVFFSSALVTEEHIQDFVDDENLDLIVSLVNATYRKAIIEMQIGNGLPKKEDIDKLKELCTIDGQLDLWLLSTIAGMLHGKGLPTTEEIDKLKQWCTIGSVLDCWLLRTITGLRRGKGLPTQQEVYALIPDDVQEENFYRYSHSEEESAIDSNRAANSMERDLEENHFSSRQVEKRVRIKDNIVNNQPLFKRARHVKQ